MENNNTTTMKLEDYSPKKPPPPPSTTASNCAGGGGDRLKRDEWSEGAVSSLLEAYEKKWVLRNRAKLKGHDWEDVAKFVSTRSNSTKSPKTQTQCKNKIESMKKRYRSESATSSSAGDHSSWPLYPRLDLLLRGSNAPPPPLPPPPQLSPQAVTMQLPVATVVTCTNSVVNAPLPPPLMMLEPSSVMVVPPLPPVTVTPVVPTSLPQHVFGGPVQNSYESNGFDRVAKEDHVQVGIKSPDHQSDKEPSDTDSSTPALYSDKEKFKSSKKMKTMSNNNNNKKTSSRRKRDNQESEIADSIRWLAEVVVRSEQARMEALKEIEKMRAESEAKRGEMDLKRTEIIANTHLEIAKLFAASVTAAGGSTSNNSNNKDKNVDPSLRIGRS
ncbi:hypothetical protein ACFE04_009101 [Oxalis oulophora]